jgi:hypothetical protein
VKRVIVAAAAVLAVTLTLGASGSGCEPTQTTHSNRPGNACAMAAGPEFAPGGCAHPAGRVRGKYAVGKGDHTKYVLDVGKFPDDHNVTVTRQAYARCGLGDRYPSCAKGVAS